MADPSQEEQDVVEFLQKSELSHYTTAVLEAGFDELDVLMDAEDRDLDDLGVAAHEVAKFRDAIESLRRQCLDDARTAEAANPWEVCATKASGGHPAPLTEEARQGVKRTWAQIVDGGIKAWENILYFHTFELFPPEAPIIAKHFGRATNIVADFATGDGVEEPEALLRRMTETGSRHINYFVQEGYWRLLGVALDRAFAELLGDAYGPDVRAAWAQAYWLVSAAMLRGMHSAGAMLVDGSALQQTPRPLKAPRPCPKQEYEQGQEQETKPPPNSARRESRSVGSARPVAIAACATADLARAVALRQPGDGDELQPVREDRCLAGVCEGFAHWTAGCFRSAPFLPTGSGGACTRPQELRMTATGAATNPTALTPSSVVSVPRLGAMGPSIGKAAPPWWKP